jgi:hypothetical protein
MDQQGLSSMISKPKLIMIHEPVREIETFSEFHFKLQCYIPNNRVFGIHEVILYD